MTHACFCLCQQRVNQIHHVLGVHALKNYSSTLCVRASSQSLQSVSRLSDVKGVWHATPDASFIHVVCGLPSHYYLGGCDQV